MKSFYFVLSISMLLSSLGANNGYAENANDVSDFSGSIHSSASTPMVWNDSLPIVDQLQAIYRIAQQSDPGSILMLTNALNSHFSLTRRKAASLLLEKSLTADSSQKALLLQSAKPYLSSPDPIVQFNLSQLTTQN